MVQYIPRNRPTPIEGMLATATRAMVEGTLVDGSAIGVYEDRFAAEVSVPRAHAFSSARAAMYHTFMALGLPRGSKVVVPSFTASIVPNVVRAAGLDPVFVDVCPDTMNMDPERLRALPDGSVSVVLATHLEGRPAPMDDIMDIAEELGAVVMEDCAHALGATYRGRPVGSFGVAGFFSTGKGKILNTIKGGVVTTTTDDLSRALRVRMDKLPTQAARAVLQTIAFEAAVEAATSTRLFTLSLGPMTHLASLVGLDPVDSAMRDSDGPVARGAAGTWTRLSNVQAMYGLVGFERLHDDIARRRAILSTIEEAASARGIAPQRTIEGAVPTPLEATVRVPDRHRLQRHLLSRGIDTQRTWMRAYPELDAFQGHDPTEAAVAMALSREALYLPLYPTMDDVEVSRICRALAEYP